AWAKASGRYEGCPEDPAKWKTNFRCALRSTRMFMLLEDRSKCGDDPHKVFAIAPGEPGPMGACTPSGKTNFRCALRSTRMFMLLEDRSKCGDDPHKVFAIAPDSTDPTRPLPLEDMEVLQWVLQQCDISPRNLGSPTPSWVPAAFQPWVPVEEQPPLGAYGPPDSMLLEDE
ncbi:PREDICTED: interferon regulatory factor 3-like, partial [Phaethon lepturus]|uniref:interferon regulatory factor 3-like n=1 Tax=Phaethon lepturus TaxID=97097 RepID=UPI0005304E71